MDNVLYDCKDYQDIREIIDEIYERFPNNIAFTVKEKKDGKTSLKDITYKTFKNQIDYLGTALIDMGLKDEKIAVIGKNRYEWAVSYYGVINGAGIVVPLDKGLPEIETETSLIRSGAKAIICEETQLEYIKDIKKRGKTELKTIICMDKVKDKDIYYFYDLINNGEKLVEKKKDRRFIDAKIDKDALATIIFTSGTTSAPKAVALSHYNIAQVVYGLDRMEKIYDDDTNFCILPFHHTFGSTGLLFMMSNGSRNVFCDGLRHIQSNIVEYGVSVFIAVPLLIESMDKKIWQAIEKQGKTKLVKVAMKVSNFLMKLHIDIRKKVFKDIHEQLGGKLRFIVNGAAALDKNVCKDFYAWGFDIVQGYGLTETSPVLSGENLEKFRFGSIGMAMSNVEIKIDNPDENGIGELIARGPNVMLGYYDDEEATKEIIKDGWIYTGDLAYKDKDGFIFITGRKKNVIVLKNGKNIFPEELEQVINKRPYVIESMVFGYPKGDDFVVSCKVVYDKDYMKDELKLEDEDEIQKYIWKEIKEINKDMPQYKHIKKLYISDEEMVKTSTAKIKRFQEIDKIIENDI
ncbi:MAG: AMP-binding protein [Clostridia bacterium]|nr:AMP-binding protein [Clostridia bacterium]